MISLQFNTERNSKKIWWNNLKDLTWPRCKAVAEFRLTTRHDCLLKHLHRIHVAHTSFCTLYDFREDMDANHIRRFPSLKGSSLCNLATYKRSNVYRNERSVYPGELVKTVHKK
ncbi:hypothetical protein TNCV_2534611 [Trichonephila clavipes]|nr:hypothetical protein TNCV_2534611 [Trichonephila clavipes]